jgi:hypothetical protein
MVARIIRDRNYDLGITKRVDYHLRYILRTKKIPQDLMQLHYFFAVLRATEINKSN